MITINPKRNQKLLETFNNDPYSDITVRTQSSTLDLVQSYLMIDSEYFDNLAVETTSVDLSHLPEQPLLRVLRSLYGEELVAKNIQELDSLLEMIDYLGISDYRQNIVSEIRHNTELFNRLDLIEFCLKYSLLEDEILKYHFARKLSVLTDPRNYLQLSNISTGTLNLILMKYSEWAGPDSDRMISGIMDNYFDRNNIRSIDYFETECPQALRDIWEKDRQSVPQLLSGGQAFKKCSVMANSVNFPHSDSLECKEGSNEVRQMSRSIMPSSIFMQSNSQTQLLGSSVQSGLWEEIEEKERMINKLLREVELKEQILRTMKQQIKQIEESGKHRTENEQTSPNLVEDQSLDLSLIDPQHKSEDTISAQFDCSIIEPAFDKDRKVSNPQRQLKTMSRLNSKSSKRLFNC